MIALKGEIIVKWEKGIDRLSFLSQLRETFPESGINGSDTISVYKNWVYIGSLHQGDAILKTKCSKYIVLPKSCF